MNASVLARAVASSLAPRCSAYESQLRARAVLVLEVKS